MTERLSDDHLTMLRTAIEERKAAEVALGFAMRVLAAAYQLKPADRVDETGEITRAVEVEKPT